ncbi:hypothetical protein CAPTEDRAFT_152500 [Capitella teleta]|uniref:FAM69 protein-kinase domain-containing protein n=1 Tax=Capitella teleta TaxID=283909 RepID=R7TH25_CAPTE|nr:hypothetical protein CAPTEDRAFT_152500 [Capitella teleta]|eukprot:ELT90410.1 hypothetical protein CAPTEDRAFT_152500 [Capitella teleta]
MDRCEKWLTCDDVQSQDFSVFELIGSGAVKMVHRATWRKFNVALNSLQNLQYSDDFHHGLRLLQALQPSDYVIQFIGACGDWYVTEFQPSGSASQMNLGSWSTLHRFELCVNYVQILHFLHNNSLGVLVMCDSNDLQKTLSQYLVTENASLLLNDVDSLALRLGGADIKCGHRELRGEFIAPEQKWPHPDQEFSDTDMPGYDEKTDIWKIPEVCAFFLGDDVGGSIRFHLFKIHKKCRSVSAIDRPTAGEVLEEYLRVKREIFKAV